MICFQEVLPHVAAWLKENLTEYTVIGCGRSETLEDEQMTVAFRTKRLNLINMETFWLSPTPYVPASRYEEQSICPRVCTEVVLEDLQEKKVFRLCDIHLDHLGVQARTMGLSQILKKMDDAVLFANAPVILAGDFNAEPDGEEFAVIRERKDYVNYTEGIGITYHGYLVIDNELYLYQKSKRRLCRTYLQQCKKMGRPRQRSMAFRPLSDLRGT